MGFFDLDLWKQEEIRIQTCIEEALINLLQEGEVKADEIEDSISGKLYHHLIRAKKKHRLVPNAKRQIAVYDENNEVTPIGYPDFGFVWNDTEYNQIEYHVECKRLSCTKKAHCKDYVKKGIKRYQDSLYSKNQFSGTMIGYIQEGDCEYILNNVNISAKEISISQLALIGDWKRKGVSKLDHKLSRPEQFSLFHYWADFNT